MTKKITKENINERVLELKKNMQDKTGWSILLGAGASICAKIPTMRILTEIVLDDIKDNKKLLLTKEIAKNLQKEGTNSQPTIESILEELYLMLHLHKEGKVGVKITYGNIEKTDKTTIETNISSVKKIIKRECSKVGCLDTHEEFVNYWMSGMYEVNIFTTNWDSLVERTCDKLRLKCIDGFSGIYDPFIDLATYDDETSRAGEKVKTVNLFKLHGSVDWIKKADNIKKNINQKESSKEEIMIYPTPLKTREILSYPYSELLRRFSNAIHGKQPKKLLVIGYSFPDSHINNIITQALQNENFSLFVIDPNLNIDYIRRTLGQYLGIFDPISSDFENAVKLICTEEI